MKNRITLFLLFVSASIRGGRYETQRQAFSYGTRFSLGLSEISRPICSGTWRKTGETHGLTSLREGRGRGADAAEGADHVARRGMLERLQTVRWPPWKRPAGATE